MQKGQIYRVGNCWLLRYREPVIENGKVRMKQTAKKIATYCREYRTAESVRPLADLILAPINAKTARPDSIETLANFLEHVYLEACRTELKPSTVKGYTDMFKLVQPHLNGLQLRDARTSDIERMLRGVADSKDRAKTTLSNARNFLSGAFRYAIRTDRFNRENPVREVKVPKGKRPEHVHAYGLEEVTGMINAVDEPAKTVLLVAALSGLRHSEIRGLRWEDFTGGDLVVRRSVWRTWISDDEDTKTKKSAAAVPCVPYLKQALLAHRKRTSGNGFIFAGSTTKPLVLANLLRRDIKPALKKAKLEWKGWHGFRRGLSSNLYRLGVPDMVIQRILRHANVATTQTHYVKTSDPDAKAAMRRLQIAFNKTKRSQKPASRRK